MGIGKARDDLVFPSKRAEMPSMPRGFQSPSLRANRRRAEGSIAGTGQDDAACFPGRLRSRQARMQRFMSLVERRTGGYPTSA